MVHVLSSKEFVYNRRRPRWWERRLVAGDGRHVPVALCGDLGVIARCKEYVRVQLADLAVVPDLTFEIMPFH